MTSPLAYIVSGDIFIDYLAGIKGLDNKICLAILLYNSNIKKLHIFNIV